MKRMICLAALTLLLAVAARADAPKLPSPEDKLSAQVAEAKWVVPKVPGMPPGPMASPIAADPTSGASIAYTKLPAGYTLPLHWHSTTEYTVLISGKATLKVDGKPIDVAPGTYVVIPPKSQHELTCASGSECLLLTRRSGPTDYNWVK